MDRTSIETIEHYDGKPMGSSSNKVQDEHRDCRRQRKSHHKKSHRQQDMHNQRHRRRKRRRNDDSDSCSIANSSSSSDSTNHSTRHRKRHKRSTHSKKEKKKKYIKKDYKSQDATRNFINESAVKVDFAEPNIPHEMQRSTVDVPTVETNSVTDPVCSTDVLLQEQPTEKEKRRKMMVPMTREEYETQQSQVRQVYDIDSGRYRLVRGTGEIIESIVSKAQHHRINQNATLCDGQSFLRDVYHNSTVTKKY